MKTPPSAPNYKGFRFPSEIISHTVWLYFRFSLSFRDIEELLAQRGIVVTYETVRQRLPSDFSANCSKDYNTSLASSLLIS